MVMTYIDHSSKIVHLAPFQESDACTMAEKFLKLMVSQHGLPECITDNHDSHFYGHFWYDLMSLFDTTLTSSTTSYPQTDGIAEVMNQTIEHPL